MSQPLIREACIKPASSLPHGFFNTSPASGQIRADEPRSEFSPHTPRSHLISRAAPNPSTDQCRRFLPRDSLISAEPSRHVAGAEAARPGPYPEAITCLALLRASPSPDGEGLSVSITGSSHRHTPAALRCPLSLLGHLHLDLEDACAIDATYQIGECMMAERVARACVGMYGARHIPRPCTVESTMAEYTRTQ
jgi:hypothetical protein